MNHTQFSSKHANTIMLLVLTVFLLTLNGCAVTAKGEMFSLSEYVPDKVVIYHFRESAFKGSAFSYDILSNGAPLTRLGNGGYYKEVATPGNISYRTLLTSDKGPFIPLLILDNVITNSYQEFEQAFSFDAAPGKIYFLKWTPNIFGGPPDIEIIRKSEALNSISELRSYPPAQTPQTQMQ